MKPCMSIANYTPLMATFLYVHYKTPTPFLATWLLVQHSDSLYASAFEACKPPPYPMDYSRITMSGHIIGIYDCPRKNGWSISQEGVKWEEPVMTKYTPSEATGAPLEYRQCYGT